LYYRRPEWNPYKRPRPFPQTYGQDPSHEEDGHEHRRKKWNKGTQRKEWWKNHQKRQQQQSTHEPQEAVPPVPGPPPMPPPPVPPPAPPYTGVSMPEGSWYGLQYLLTGYLIFREDCYLYDGCEHE